MREYITQNRDGVEACRELRSKKTGFEKFPDGNFYKKLGDQRCITGKIRLKEIKAERLLKKQEVEEANQPHIIAVKSDTYRPIYTSLFKAAAPVSINHVESCLMKRMTTYKPEVVVLISCEVKHKCGLDTLRVGTKWSKIELDRVEGKALLWKEFNCTDKPDIEIRDAVE